MATQEWLEHFASAIFLSFHSMYPVSRHDAPSAATQPAPPAAQPPAGAMCGISNVRTAQAGPGYGVPGYGLLDSRLDPYYAHTRINPYTTQSSCPNYPVNPLLPACPQGGLELDGLQLLSLGAGPIDAVRYATGALFLFLAKAEIDGPRGKTALIGRIILPAGGSAIYAGLARSACFVGDILIGEPNAVIANALEQLLQYPDRVMVELKTIFSEIRDVCLKHHVELDENLCRRSGTNAQMRDARAAFTAYLRTPGIHRTAIFPDAEPANPSLAAATAIARASAAAFTWLTLEDRQLQHGRAPPDPTFDSLDRLVFPVAQSFTRDFLGGGEAPCLMRRKLNLHPIVAVHSTKQSLFCHAATAPEDTPALKTEVVHDPNPTALLEGAGPGDLIVFDDRFHRFARNLFPDYLRHFGNMIRASWEKGARVLFVSLNMAPGSREILEQQGLHTHWQAGKANWKSGEVADRIEATAQGGYVLAMNFDPSTRDYDLLPLPPA
jgi:hypothetical protein